MTWPVMVGVLLLFVGLPLLVVSAWDRFARKRGARAFLTAETDWARRMHHPDIGAIERVLGGAPPQVLSEHAHGNRAFDRDIVCSVEDHEWAVERFLPLDARVLSERWDGMPGDALPIAMDPSGGQYFIRLTGASSDDPTVALFDHDGGETFEVSKSLRSFLAAPRRKERSA